jgi:hypothetical protein
MTKKKEVKLKKKEVKFKEYKDLKSLLKDTLPKGSKFEFYYNELTFLVTPKQPKNGDGIDDHFFLQMSMEEAVRQLLKFVGCKVKEAQ